MTKLKKDRAKEDPHGIGHRTAVSSGSGKPSKKLSNPLPYHDVANDNYIIKF